MSASQFSWLGFVFTLIVGALFTVAAPPNLFLPWYPNMLLLLVFAWCWAHPERFGIVFAFFIGLICDLLYGTVLGRLGVSFALGVYLITLTERYLANFAMAHRAITVVALVMVVELLGGMILMVTLDKSVLGNWWITQAIGSGICWPLVQWLVMKSDRLDVMHEG